MSRPSPYLGIALAILFGLSVFILSNELSPATGTAPETSANALSISITDVPSAGVSSSEVAPSVATTSAGDASSGITSASDVADKDSISPPPVETGKSVAAVQIPAVVPTQADIDAALTASASSLRSALVNIICYAPAGGGIHSISGSGVFIDSKGIILTNAHIAQYFLYADRGVSCTIRTGGPATDSYKAALIYFPPTWARVNADILTKTNPTGTGEYDFALLAVTKSTNGTALPSTFPAVPLAETPPVVGAPVVIASYGAQFLETSQVQSSLFPTIVFGSVKDIFTFSGSTVDVISLGGSVAAQEGSSGGGAVDASGALIGTITTSTVSGATDTRTLEAITASYVRAEYASEMGEPINLLLNEPVTTAVADFATRISVLESILTASLP